MVGLQPKHFAWIIPRRLAASERPGGQGKVHRRVRRDEELNWIRRSPITRILSLLGSAHNLEAYESAGIPFDHVPIEHPSDALAKLGEVYARLDEALDNPEEAVLVHLDEFDDLLCGILSGYLVHGGYVPSGTIAVALMERITERPMGPEGREMVFSVQPPPARAQRR
jgi:hypothetical protein